MLPLAALVILAACFAPSCQRGSGVDVTTPESTHQSTGSQPSSGGDSTEGPNFVISHPTLSMSTDALGRLELRVTPRGGFKNNTEYPWLLTLSPPESLGVDRQQWDVSTMERLTEEEALFQIPVSAREAGQYEVDGHLRFSVCNDVRCDTPQADVSWSVTVE